MNSNLSKLMVGAMVSGLIAGVSTARADEHGAAAKPAAAAAADKHTSKADKKAEKTEKKMETTHTETVEKK